MFWLIKYSQDFWGFYKARWGLHKDSIHFSFRLKNIESQRTLRHPESCFISGFRLKHYQSDLGMEWFFIIADKVSESQVLVYQY